MTENERLAEAVHALKFAVCDLLDRMDRIEARVSQIDLGPPVIGRPMSDICETCGNTDDELWCCMDTLFCRECRADFGTERWKGIGSKLPKSPCLSVAKETK